MAMNVKSFFLVALLLLNWFLFTSGARPLNDAEYSAAAGSASAGSSITQGLEVFLDGMSLAAIKTGGPSPGGKGHAFTDAFTNSGPSSGGNGHAFTDAFTNSGPSSGTDGH